jgi:Holliday junction resolvase
MTPEAKVKNKVKKILDSLGCYHFSPLTGGYGRSGVPDIIVCHKGLFIAIECKAGKGKLTELQKYNMEQIKASGGLAIMVNEGNIEELLTQLKEVI